MKYSAKDAGKSSTGLRMPPESRRIPSRKVLSNETLWLFFITATYENGDEAGKKQRIVIVFCHRSRCEGVNNQGEDVFVVCSMIPFTPGTFTERPFSEKFSRHCRWEVHRNPKKFSLSCELWLF